MPKRKSDHPDSEAESEDEDVAAVTKRVKLSPAVGTLEKLELHNFMCHKYLEFDFGSSINFIIGQNGSGKSAVLAGITIALGGRANATGRGTSLKPFIKEGEQVAEVSVVINNSGDEGFKRAQYGDKIIVTKLIVVDGPGSWKIKSFAGKTIATTKAELNALTDHFGIQVDNPMNILSQDTARKFLASSQASEKYQFFLRGTQLSQLSQEYTEIRYHLKLAGSSLKRNAEILPDLESAAKEAKRKFDESTRARGIEEKVATLNEELAWSFVTSAEKDLETTELDLDAQQLRVKPAKIKIDENEVRIAAIDEEITSLEGEIRGEEGGHKPSKDRMRQLKEEIAQNKDQLVSAQSTKDDIQAHTKVLATQIKRFEDTIKMENAKLEVDNNAKFALVHEELAKLRSQMQELEEQKIAANSAIAEIEEQQSSDRQRLQNCKDSFAGRDEELRVATQKLNTIKNSKKDSMLVFGPGMSALCQAVARDKSWRSVPIGPIGKYVSSTDSRWNSTLESIFGQTLNFFVVENQHDQHKLTNMMRAHRCSTTIIIRKNDDFDYTAGEPPKDVLTIARVIKCDVPSVLRVLVDLVHIESAALAKNRQEATDLVKKDIHNISGCFAADGNKVTFNSGVTSNTAIHAWTGGPRLSSDLNEAVQQAEQACGHIRGELQRLRGIKASLDKQLGSYERQVAEHHQSKKACSSKISRLKTAITSKEEELREDEPPNIQALEATRDEVKLELTQVGAQYAATLKTVDEINAANRPLIAEYDALRTRENEADSRRQELQKTKVERLVSERAQLSANKEHYTNILEKTVARIQSLRQDVEEKSRIKDNLLETATRIQPVRSRSKRDSKKIETEIDQLNAALKQREKRQGASNEEIAERYEAAELAYQTANVQINTMDKFIQDMKSALKLRTQTWLRFRSHIALRAKTNFAYYLNVRGYTGKLTFDHKKEKLDLKVNTEDKTGGKSSADKDAKTLSGGEKSFSTICLLLSLWDAVGAPIRALDEFDVYMDAVNRRISIAMVLDYARSTEGIQHILITPQDMTNIVLGDDVKTNRMPDPERSIGNV